MSKIITALAALTFCTSAAQAQSWTQSRVGPYTNYQGRDQYGREWTGTSSSIGNSTTYQFRNSDGRETICKSDRVGQFTTTNCE